MKTTIYDKLYIANVECLSKKMEKNFLMCGRYNWDWYFIKVDKDVDAEVLENVKFIEFEDEEEFDEFLENNEIIDFSVDFEEPCAIAYA